MADKLRPRVIMPGWKRYLVRFEGHLTEEERQKIGLAYRLGKEAHRGQYRGDGVTYFFKHCRDLGDMISCELGLKDSWEINAVPFVHDTVEDNEQTTLITIEKELGPLVAYWTDLVTKGDQYKKDKSSFIRRLRESREIPAIILKLGDRVVNLRTLGMVPNDEFQIRQINETIVEYLPLADLLIDLLLNSSEWKKRSYVGVHLREALQTQIASFKAEFGDRIICLK